MRTLPSAEARASAPTGRASPVPLGLILALGLGLRLWGLGWGLPNEHHYYSYHPDEAYLLQTSSPAFGGLDLPHGKFLPHFYIYGPYHLYFVNLALSVGNALGLLGPVLDGRGALQWRSLADSYYTGRLVTVLLGAATIWVLHAIGSLLWSRTAGLLAALALALFPLHAQHSHFLTVDVPMTFWISLSLLWACRTHAGAVGERRGALYAAILAGLAAATKYVGGMALLAVLVPIVLRRRAAGAARPRRIQDWGLGLIALALGVTALAFLIACPGVFLEHREWVDQLEAMSMHFGGGGVVEIPFLNVGPGWLFVLKRNLGAGLGPPMLLLALAGFGYGLWRRSPGDIVLASFALPFFGLVGFASSLYARYDMPLLPVAALWVGRLSAVALARASGGAPQVRVAAIGLVTAIFAFTLVYCASILLPMSQTDPRDRAAKWLAIHAPVPTRIGFALPPWCWTPPLTPVFPYPAETAYLAHASKAQRERCIFNLDRPFDFEQLAQVRPPVVVLSEFQYVDYLRRGIPDAVAYLDLLRREYREPILFKSAHPLLRARFIDGLPTQDLPHDMGYPSPAILIYTRTDS